MLCVVIAFLVYFLTEYLAQNRICVCVCVLDDLVRTFLTENVEKTGFPSENRLTPCPVCGMEMTQITNEKLSRGDIVLTLVQLVY